MSLWELKPCSASADVAEIDCQHEVHKLQNVAHHAAMYGLLMVEQANILKLPGCLKQMNNCTQHHDFCFTGFVLFSFFN